MVNDARWLASLETRHLRDLTFPEVSRALRALSSLYVERRGRIAEGAALTGAGKRAAFALFYAPLHFLLLQRILPELPGALDGASQSVLVDLGCGTGAAGAAWAVAAGFGRVVGIDRNRWALGEAAETYRAFGLNARTRHEDVVDAKLPSGPAGLLAAFTVNELPDAGRDALLDRLVDRASIRGNRLLIVEPIARSSAPWWAAWRRRVEAAGGRADEWRFPVELPPIVAKLDRAAGLNHRELTGRTLWLSTPAADRAASS
jgi:SAM-dependent methyltransferase